MHGIELTSGLVNDTSVFAASKHSIYEADRVIVNKYARPKLPLKFRDSFCSVLHMEALRYDQQNCEYLLLTIVTNYGAFESLSLAVAP